MMLRYLLLWLAISKGICSEGSLSQELRFVIVEIQDSGFSE